MAVQAAPRPNRRPDRRCHRRPPSSSAPLRRAPSPGHPPPPNRASVRSPAISSPSLTYSPLSSVATAAESPLRRHGRSVRRARTPPALPARACAPPPRALGPPGPSGHGAARLRRRQVMAGAEYGATARAPPCAAESCRTCLPAPPRGRP